MGKDFENDPRYPEGEFPEGIAGNKVDKRDIAGSQPKATAKRLKDRKVEGGENFDAADSVDKANSVLDRLVERGIIELVRSDAQGEDIQTVGTKRVRLLGDEDEAAKSTAEDTEVEFSDPGDERAKAKDAVESPDPEGDVKADVEKAKAADAAKSK